jgi:hypothetical protein
MIKARLKFKDGREKEITIGLGHTLLQICYENKHYVFEAVKNIYDTKGRLKKVEYQEKSVEDINFDVHDVSGGKSGSS